ncbi:MAG: hypothetical protein ACREEK_15085 [Bradyrhizobium sp.]
MFCIVVILFSDRADHSAFDGRTMPQDSSRRCDEGHTSLALSVIARLCAPNTVTANVPAIEPTSDPAALKPGSAAAMTANRYLIDGCWMQFFLYEIVARVVAIYLCVDCNRRFWNGLAERKIEIVSDDILDWSTWVFQRDEMPVRYWMSMAGNITTLLACLVVAIFGWWHPNG